MFFYGVEGDQIKLYVDDNLFSTVNKADVGTNTYPFNELFYLVVNFAVGGNFRATQMHPRIPQWLIVDYIRVYQ